jgi:hypothetical protein
LLQKVLVNHSGAKSIPESWFLLKSMVGLRGVCEWKSNFGAKACYNALVDFEKVIGCNLVKAHFDLYRNLLNNLDGSVFIEKTPRNYLIINEIIDNLRSEDQVILLRRDSRDVFISYMRYFKLSYIKSYKYFLEIKVAQRVLDNVALSSKVVSISYEDLVNDPVRELDKTTTVCDLDRGVDISDNIGLKNKKGDQSRLMDTRIERRRKSRFDYLYGLLWDIYRLPLLGIIFSPISFLPILTYYIVKGGNKSLLH